MQVKQRTNGAELWVLVLSITLVFASISVATSQAQTSGSKSSGTVEDLGPTSGDPDMPGSDAPPTGSGTTGSFESGTGVTLHSSTVAATPGKKFGAWAHWKVALKLYLRGGLR